MRLALALLALSGLSPVLAATPVSPSPLPCFASLKFGGSLYLDADQVVPAVEIGRAAGETDPNPTHCGIPDRVTVYQHVGHPSTTEVVYRRPDGAGELFRSAGESGFPAQNLVKWLVAALAAGILIFAALPALLGHLRRPPIEVGSDKTDWRDDLTSDREPGEE
jgi:hypothetical protein